MNGIKVEGQKITCAECGQNVSKDGKLILNFCPKCGNPLNIQANVKYEKKVAKDKIIMLYELLDLIEEGNDATTQIKEFIKELNEN